MKIGRMNAGVLLAVGILGLATGPAWAGKPKPAAAPETQAADTKEFDKGATASPQTVTVVESDNASFYLSGTGPRWTLVTAPQHGAIKLWNGKNWTYRAWVPGATEVNDSNPNDAEVARGVHGIGYVQYYPTPGYMGPDSFTWHSSDASATSKDVVCSITVTANHAPVANNQSVTCAQGVTNKYVGLNYTHADSGGFADRYYSHIGQTMSFTLVSAPTHGTLKYYNGGKNGSPQGDYLSVPAGKPIPYYGWSYTPNEGYSGSDNFTWKCNDTFVDSGTATATITVTPKGVVATAKPVPVSKDGTYVGPGDIVPDAMAWYGTRGYSRAVAATGTQKAVLINRYNDGASMDVLIKPNGDLDAAAAAAFCAGTLARVELWYDQSGHGNDIMGGCHPQAAPLLTTLACSKMTKSGTPYSEFTLDSLPCVEIQGDDRQFTNTKFVGASPVGTFSAVASRRGGGFGGQIMLMNALNGRSLITWLLFVSPGFNQATLDVSTFNNGGTRLTTSIDETDRAAFHAFQGVINGASSVLNVDGTSTPGNLDPANLSGSFWSGGNYGGGGFMGKMTELGVWPTAFSSDEQTAMYQNQRNYWHLPTLTGFKRSVAEVNVARQAPPIDGTLANRLWWTNPALLLGKVESTDIGSLQTTAYVIMDKQNLYVAWHCLEKDTDALVANATERDGAALRSDDSVEMFLSPDEKTYYHFAVNSKGVFADGKGALNQKEDLAWNSTATVKTSVDKGRGWTVTMSLPLSDLGVTSGKSQKWMLNLNRTKPAKDQSGKTTFIQSSWASSGRGNYADASGWGKLTNVNIQ